MREIERFKRRFVRLSPRNVAAAVSFVLLSIFLLGFACYGAQLFGNGAADGSPRRFQTGSPGGFVSFAPLTRVGEWVDLSLYTGRFVR
jgi:hypothetical protein